MEFSYKVTQTINNYENPAPYDTTTHQIFYNISVEDNNDWQVSARYEMNMYNVLQDTTEKKEDNIEYSIDNNDYKVKGSTTSDNGINLNSFPSSIRCNTSLGIGEVQAFRVDGLTLLSYFGLNKTVFEYKKAEAITISGSSYDVMVFRGNTTDFLACS